MSIDRRFMVGDEIVLTTNHDGLKRGSKGIIRVHKNLSENFGIEVTYSSSGGTFSGHNLAGKLRGKNGWYVPDNKFRLSDPKKLKITLKQLDR